MAGLRNMIEKQQQPANSAIFDQDPVGPEKEANREADLDRQIAQFEKDVEQMAALAAGFEQYPDSDVQKKALNQVFKFKN